MVYNKLVQYCFDVIRKFKARRVCSIFVFTPITNSSDAHVVLLLALLAFFRQFQRVSLSRHTANI